MSQIKIFTLEDCVSLSEKESRKIIGGCTQLESLQEPKKPLQKKIKPKYIAIASVTFNCPAAIPATENPTPQPITST